MAPHPAQHRRTHNLLLVNNLLNHSGNVSPFTLVLDSLEQSGKPLLREVLTNAVTAKVAVVFISFESIRRPDNINEFIPAWQLAQGQWHKTALTHVETYQKAKRPTGCLVVIDSLNTVCSTTPTEVPALLSSLISPSVALLALHHSDIVSTASVQDPYSPQPISLLTYMATTIFTTHSLHHVLLRKAAADRSVVEPSFGLNEGEPGILQGLGANTDTRIVLEMEHRRKSGRGVKEFYVLDTRRRTRPAAKHNSNIGLLEDFPGYHAKLEASDVVDESLSHHTFELGLTDKQRQDRDGVVLPYFDAQKGSDEGGRILYDMGSEDDFDEEEDEI